jgi:DNA-binding beta-propeller fold protein YncE
MANLRRCSRSAEFLIVAGFLLAAIIDASAHPGSGIVVDAKGRVYFVDTGQGVWMSDTQGKLTLIHRMAYHWMALDEQGHFASSNTLGEFDRGSFERITPAGSTPTIIISSDYPIAVGQDGSLYYVPYSPSGPRELIRRTSTGQRSVFARLPSDTSGKPMMWVNGIAAGPDGLLYVTNNDEVLKIDKNGTVSTVRSAIQIPDCADPLPDTPKLPYLRGLAVAPDGTIYAAANGCRAVIAMPAKGPIRTLLKSEPPWSPTGVALRGSDIYVLEYLHTPGDNRREWIPRLRRITAGGRITTVATVEREKK